MKTIEEKAKAYDMALETARKINSGEGVPAPSGWTKLEVVFPQLRESEDEKIRKQLIAIMNFLGRDNAIFSEGQITKEQAIAYLEKQKEQKPWKVGANAYFTPEQEPVVTHGETYHVDTLGTQQVIAGKMPQKAAWSEEDERIIDTIVSVLGQYIDYKAVSGTGSGYATPRYNKEIDWLKSLRPQPKVELSEDVKKTLDEVSFILIGLNYKQIAKDYKQAIEKLLYSRPSWKPTEEQMEVLLNAEGLVRANNYNENAKILASLYEQLKKL